MKPYIGDGIVLRVPLPNTDLVAAGMAAAEPCGLLSRRRRPFRRVLVVGWHALVLDFGLGGTTALLVLVSLLG